MITLGDIATILSIAGGLLAIFFGILRLKGMWRKRKEKRTREASEHDMPEFPIPPEALKSREIYGDILLKRLASLRKEEKDDLGEHYVKMVDAESLTDSTIPFPARSVFVDCICTAVTKEGRTILLIPSGESYPDVEGVGRTSVLLRLLGLTVDTGRLIGLQLDDVRSLEGIPLHVASANWCHILATDMAYLGCSGKKLSLIPTKGEIMSFLWDLSRHVFRMSELGYRTGDHRREPGRQKLLQIFNKIRFRQIGNLFGNLDTLHPVDEVILFRRNITAEPSSPKIRELDAKERLQQLNKALLVSAQHGSTFWHRNQRKLSRYVDYVVNSLDLNGTPAVYEIYFSYPEAAMPSHYFDDIAEIVKSKQNLTQLPTNVPAVPIRGIAHHNNRLTRGFQDVDEVRLLVTSGEKIFKDVGFWNALSGVKKRITLRILMLNPRSPLTKTREKEAYADKPEGFLANEIRENIETLKRMNATFSKVQNPVKISCNIYDEPPSFRMTFIGRQTLLVTSYEKGRRTGQQTVFYEISPQYMEAIFDGFDREYQRIEAHSRPLSNLE